MTYGDNVGNENRDEIWTQQVKERNAANTLGGLHAMYKAEQTHPSEHNGAAMQSPGERMGTMSLMRNMLPLALAGGAVAANQVYQNRQAQGQAQWMQNQLAQNQQSMQQTIRGRRDTRRASEVGFVRDQSLQHGLTMLTASPSGRQRMQNLRYLRRDDL